MKNSSLNMSSSLSLGAVFKTTHNNMPKIDPRTIYIKPIKWLSSISPTVADNALGQALYEAKYPWHPRNNQHNKKLVSALPRKILNRACYLADLHINGK